jgi:RNA polymerase sigma-70 factor, ECF subfamily
MVTDARKAVFSRFEQGHPTLNRSMTEDALDIDLIRHMAAGDPADMGELYARYGQRLYAYALRLTGHPAQAEDVTQDALVSAWRGAAGFRGKGRVISWLLGIVHHTAMKSLRHAEQPISDEMEDTLPAPALSLEDQAQANEQAHMLRRGLQSLSLEHRAVLELVFYQKMSLEEVAQITGCPLGTVKSRLSYARQYLRGVLSRMEVKDE